MLQPMLRERLGESAPSELELRVQLRAALQAELERERTEARAAVEQQLSSVVAERDAHRRPDVLLQPVDGRVAVEAARRRERGW